MRRVLLVAFVATALLVSAVGASASGGGATASKKKGTTTLRLIAEEETTQFVDVPPAATNEEDVSAGDAFVFTSRVSTRGGRRVGRLHAVCTLTATGENFASQCVGTLQLPRGQITLQGLLGDEEEGFFVAVTGGTGRYSGARGTMLVKDVPGSGDRDALTIRIRR